MHKREIIASASSSRPKRLFQFYNAKHLYMMKTAFTRRNMNINTTPRYDSHMAKRTPTAKTESLVPNFAARWHSFCKYFFTLEINNQKKQTKHQQYIKTTRLHSNRKFRPIRRNQSKVMKSSHQLKQKKTQKPCSFSCHSRHRSLQ